MKKVVIIVFFLVLSLPILTHASEPEETISNSIVITQDQTWEGTKIIDGAKVTVESGATLTLKPGTMVVGLKGALIYVKGKLKAVGENNKKIRFTSEKDRSQNFTLTYYISSVLGSEVTMQNFILEDGGGNQDVAFMPALTLKGKATLSDGIIRRNRVTGVRFWNNNNDETINNCEIYENEGLAVENKSTNVLLAQNNWWGSEKGPSTTATKKPQAYIWGNINFTPWQAKGPIPVIVIPGFGGSFSFKLLSDQAGDSWWFNPVGTSGYRYFTKALIATGYASGRDFFWFSYDFRKGNKETANQELKDLIQIAKEKSGHREVNIVSHSMGGLLARSYVEGSEFFDDVDRLVTAGTPHLGSSETYGIWEGGELTGLKKVLSPYLWYLGALNNNLDSLDLIHQKFPSLSEMLPVYNYLVKKESGEEIPYGTQQEKNNFLEELNSPDNLKDFKRKIFSTLVVGTGEETLEKITVKDPPMDSNLWKDGLPDPLSPPKDTTKGDGTVTVKSATANGQITKEMVSLEAKHGELFQKGQKSLFEGLNITPSSPLLFKVLSNFWVTAYGPVEVEIQDESGKLVKKDLTEIEDGEYQESEIDGNQLVFANAPFDSLEEGKEKKIKVTFVGKGNSVFKAGFFFNSKDENVFSKNVEMETSAGAKASYTISLAEGSEINVTDVDFSGFVKIRNIASGEKYLNWQYLAPEITVYDGSGGSKLQEIRTNCQIDGKEGCENVDLAFLDLGEHKVKAKGSWKKNDQEESKEQEVSFFVDTSLKSLSKLADRFYQEKRMKSWSARSQMINLSSLAYQNLAAGNLLKAKEQIGDIKNLLDQSAFFREKTDKEVLDRTVASLSVEAK